MARYDGSRPTPLNVRYRDGLSTFRVTELGRFVPIGGKAGWWSAGQLTDQHSVKGMFDIGRDLA